MSSTATLIAAKSTIGKGGIKPIPFSGLYGIEVITEGTVTGLTLEIFGSISKSNMQSLATHDAIANGKLFYISGKGVNGMEAEILTIAGGGKASIVIHAAV